MSFSSASSHGFVRVAACMEPVVLADPYANAEAVIARLGHLDQEGVALACFPELGLTGYSLDDLFASTRLLAAAEEALVAVAEATRDLAIAAVVGLPLRHRDALYNCAALVAAGTVHLLAVKRDLPNYREFYEPRNFASGRSLPADAMWRCGDHEAVMTTLGVCDLPALGVSVGIEICEDLWGPMPLHADLTRAGAHIVVNPSSSPVTVGRAQRRRDLVKAASLHGECAYVYAAAGAGESSTDLAWDGQTLVYERGELLAEGPRFSPDAVATIADINVTSLRQARRENTTFTAQAGQLGATVQRVGVPAPTRLPRIPEGEIANPTIRRFPFVPNDAAHRDHDCYETFNIQVYGLTRRLAAIGGSKPVIGVSGGLDSTHALLVAARAMDLSDRPRSDILAYTLPGFATSEGTKSNAYRLADALGVTMREIDIRPSATRMLADMGHPAGSGEPVYDVTFENVQAGLRTDYLFRLANQQGGIVVGTGDLSELALGWCTYGVGDHMSHYTVNCGVPKTLIQHVIRWVCEREEFGSEASAVLDDILAQEISPELVPGRDLQSTEDTIGPYELHDFFLFYHLRGYRPGDIAFLAWATWRDSDLGEWPDGLSARHTYTLAEIVAWLRVFLTRFAQAQFKRTCVPNGPKVSPAGALSPRGDWRMPADVSASADLADLAEAVSAIPDLDER